MNRRVAWMAMAVAAAWVAGCGGGDRAEQTAAVPDQARIEKAEQDMAALRESNLLVDIDPRSCTAQVEPRLWAGTEQVVRRRMAQSMKQFCAAHGTPGGLTIMDSRSGQQLDDDASLGL